MSETLSGLDLRRAVAEALGWQYIVQCIPFTDTPDWVYWEFPGVRVTGRKTATADVLTTQGADLLPAYESDPRTLPEMWRWLEAKGMEWEQSVFLKHERKYRAYAWGRRCECREHDAANPVTAVARLVVAVALWEKEQEAGK